MRIVVYPGSFDPVHNGHLLLANEAKKAISADKVLFLLSPSTVWKKVPTSFTHRKNMLDAALNGIEGFEISLIEEQNEGKTNYTYLTLERLQALYPHDELYLLLGADQAEVFDKWMNPTEITKLATLLVYKRKGSTIRRTNIDKYNMQLIEGKLNETSSSLVRRFESIDVPSSVLEYIGKNKLYFASWISKKLNDKRYYHSFEVAKLSRLIALANGSDALKAFQAGFLHDIAKDLGEVKIQKLMEKYYPKMLDLPKWSYHQFIGGYLAKEEFDIKAKDVIRAIESHATGSPEMDRLSKILFAADKIEPTRGYDSSDLIAAMIEDVDKGFEIVLRANKEYLLKSGKSIDNRMSLGMYNKYARDK